MKIKVDHAAPRLSVSGSITEQETQGTGKSTYALKYKATDGSDAAATALTPFGAKGSAAGQFNNPSGVATDRNGHVWVVDGANNRVQEFDEGGQFIRQFGSSGSGNGQFKEPYGITVNSEGDVWVTDTGNHRVQEFGPTGSYIQQFETAGAGGGTQFTQPAGIAAAPGGMLWVSDYTDRRIAEFRESAGTSERFVRNVSGVEVGNPNGMTVDSRGYLWATDDGCACVLSFNPSGEYVSRFGSLGSAAGQFRLPTNIVATPTGNLLVADTENKRIEEFQPSGAFVRQFASSGTGNSNLSFPEGLALLNGNSLFVADNHNNRIARWSNAEYDPQSGAAGVQIKVDGVTQSPPINPECATRDCEITGEWTLKAGEFSDGSHTVEVTSTDAVGNTSVPVKIPIVLRPDRTPPSVTLSGSITEQASLGNTRPRYLLKMAASDPGSFSSSFGTTGAGSGQFNHPADVALDAKGDIWAVDKGNNRIEEFKESGEFIGSYGSLGTAGGQLSSPSAIAIDPSGNIWVADTGNNRIEEFSEKGAFVAAIGREVNKTKAESGGTEAEKNYCSAASGNICKAGPEGTAPGQLKAPQGIAATSGGNLWVADTGHSRMEKYTPTGSLLNNSFSEGSGSGQLKAPSAVAMGPDGSLWVADTGNNRIEHWNPELNNPVVFGTEGAGNGQFKHPAALEVDSGGNVWVGDEGNDRVEEFGGTGAYLAQFGSKGSGPGLFGFSAPFGIARNSKGNLLVADAANNRIVRWSYAAGTSSGVASTTIKVDGKTVDSSSPGCAGGGCSISRGWTLESGSYSAGSHTVEATATDASGLTTAKTLTVNIARDTTPPQVTANASLYTAPEGWVEQQSYPYTASASDPNGYGVTSLILKIDGAVVGEASSTCPDGSCQLPLNGSINLAAYKGGAHAAELIATDGAGNKTTKHWTINVDPKGHISTEEAEDTLEAVEATSPVNPIGPVGEEGVEGSAPGLGLVESEGKLKATGSPVPTEISAETGAVGLEIPNAGTFAPNCGEEVEEMESEPCITGVEREELMLQAELAGSTGLKAVEVDPADPGAERAGGKLVEEEVMLAPDAGKAVDETIRPLAGGALAFEAIRDASAPEEYSWRVQLEPEQELRQISDQEIAAYWPGEHLALDFFAEPAADAIGTEVPTSLKVSGSDIITLVVHHRAPSPAGGSFVYPVVAGTGWLGGFQTYEVEMPPPEEAPPVEGEEVEAAPSEEEGVVRMKLMAQGPPLFLGYVQELKPNPVYQHKFKFNECRYKRPPVETNGGNPAIPEERREATRVTQCENEVSGLELLAAMSVHGHFNISPGVFVSMPDQVSCTKWGPEQPATIQCGKSTSDRSQQIEVWGNYRFAPLKGAYFSGPTSACVTVHGSIDRSPKVLRQLDTVLTPARAAIPEHPEFQEPCQWPDHE